MIHRSKDDSYDANISMSPLRQPADTDGDDHVDFDDEIHDYDHEDETFLEREVFKTLAEQRLSATIFSDERRNSVNDETDSYYDQYPSCDTSTSHMQMGCIVIPIQVTVPLEMSEVATSSNAGHHHDKEQFSSFPSYSFGKTSRMSLFATYPPPFYESYSNNDCGKNVLTLHQQKRHLRRYSGWYGTTCFDFATTIMNDPMSLGYTTSEMSLNYRLPFFVVVPSLLILPSFNFDLIRDYDAMLRHRNRRRLRCHHHLITDLHCTMQLGPSNIISSTSDNYDILPSTGATLFTPDGRTKLRIDTTTFSNWVFAENNTCHTTLCLSSDLSHPTQDGLSKHWPVHAQFAMRMLPCRAIHNQQFLVTLSTLKNCSPKFPEHYYNRRRNENFLGKYSRHPRPDMTLCFGFGLPPSPFTFETKNSFCATDCISCNAIVPSCDIEKRDSTVSITPASCMYFGTNLKLRVEQFLPSSSKSSSLSLWHGTVEYLHAGRALTFETMLTRSFATSEFSRMGVGIRHTLFGNNAPQIRPSITSWLLQLERGGVRLLIPLTLGGQTPLTVRSWKTTFLGLIYASLASILVDVIVCELLCGMTSSLRICFLKQLIGDEYIRDTSEACRADTKNDDDCSVSDEHWHDEQLRRGKEDALRQMNLMIRQARVRTKKEEEIEGLVIVKAIYGIMENHSRQWLSRRCRPVSDGAMDTMQHHEADNSKNLTRDYHTMDATTQLQFWVSNSALYLSELPKRHLLGFYDLMESVGEDRWFANEEVSTSKILSHESPNFLSRLITRLRWRSLQESKKQRDLSVVLSIRYKFGDKMFDVIFADHQAVELPSLYASEVPLQM